jgi:hypothetical protein
MKTAKKKTRWFLKEQKKKKQMAFQMKKIEREKALNKQS